MTRNCRSHANRSHDSISKHSTYCGLGLDVPDLGASAIENSSKDFPIRDVSWTEGSTTLVDEETTSSPSVYESRTPASTQMRKSSFYTREVGPTFMGDVEPDQLSATHYGNIYHDDVKGTSLAGSRSAYYAIPLPGTWPRTLARRGIRLRLPELTCNQLELGLIAPQLLRKVPVAAYSNE